MSKIFISYARKDKDEVYPIVEELEHNGLECWIDKNGIESGDQFEDTICTAIDNCEIFLYMLSENTYASNWCKREYNYADGVKKIIPVLLKGAKDNRRVMFKVTTMDCIDIYDPIQKEKLIRNLLQWSQTQTSLDFKNKAIEDIKTTDCINPSENKEESKSITEKLKKHIKILKGMISGSVGPFYMKIESKSCHKKGYSTDVVGHISYGTVHVGDILRLNDWKKCEVLAINALSHKSDQKNHLFSLSILLDSLEIKRQPLAKATEKDGEIELCISIASSDINVNDILRDASEKDQEEDKKNELEKIDLALNQNKSFLNDLNGISKLFK